MDVRRLKIVADQCPLAATFYPSLRHTKWQAAVSPYPTTSQAQGYVQSVVENGFLSWRRTFATQPPADQSRAVLTIDEWIPAIYPGLALGWWRFGGDYLCALAPVQANYLESWSTQARRHLKTFRKSGLTLRPGTVHEVQSIYQTSQVPPSLQASFLATLEQHLRAHPTLVHIEVAVLGDRPLACFVTVDCPELQQSYYLLGAFRSEQAKLQAITGLVAAWFDRAQASALKHLNFGLIDGPRPSPGLGGAGYSIFKTHFGVQRIWYPGSFWRIRLNLRLC